MCAAAHATIKETKTLCNKKTFYKQTIIFIISIVIKCKKKLMGLVLRAAERTRDVWVYMTLIKIVSFLIIANMSKRDNNNNYYL